jgi:hypothetical protein
VGQSATFELDGGMSGLPPLANIAGAVFNAAEVPILLRNAPPPIIARLHSEPQ